MTELPDTKNATPEQKKEIEKVLSKARFSIVGISIKSFLFLFLANFIAMSVGLYVLNDVDADMQLGYHCAVILTNTIFLLNYFNGQMRKNSDIVTSKIQEILKK